MLAAQRPAARAREACNGNRRGGHRRPRSLARRDRVRHPAIGWYLGVEQYGIFVALTSLTAMLLFADLGLGNGLMNVISDALGRNDRSTAQRSVSSATFMLIGVAILLVVIAILIYPLVDGRRCSGRRRRRPRRRSGRQPPSSSAST